MTHGDRQWYQRTPWVSGIRIIQTIRHTYSLAPCTKHIVRILGRIRELTTSQLPPQPHFAGLTPSLEMSNPASFGSKGTLCRNNHTRRCHHSLEIE
ncbi:hypothetical protein AVEN_134967-1 [Araneus ventricosus]|uniref:Uncharacterized protein n=1 Tax=Araneus ventricosus TaxID=182803 RepID=A0A4Y2CH58_ARAVE|nr:hypothetical protein AVEN_134967-1 [Araneus ventricosus]